MILVLEKDRKVALDIGLWPLSDILLMREI